MGIFKIFDDILRWELVQLELKYGSIAEKKKNVTLKSFKSICGKKKNKKEWN